MAMDPILSSSSTGVTISAAQWRRLDIGSTMAHDAHVTAARAGVASGLAVTMSGLTATVSAGSAIVTPAASDNGSYRVSVTGTTSVTLAARDATYSRIDLIVLRVYDNEADGGTTYSAVPLPVTGTPAAVPVAPATPAGTIVLAQCTVPPTGTVTVSTVARQHTSALGGTIPCLSTARPSGAGLRVGQIIWESDTGQARVWTGTVWSLIAAASRLETIAFTYSAATDSNGYFTVPSIPWGSLTPTAPPVCVTWQDALVNTTVGPIWARWDVANTSATSTRCKVFQGNQTPLASYGCRFGVTVTGMVTG